MPTSKSWEEFVQSGKPVTVTGKAKAPPKPPDDAITPAEVKRIRKKLDDVRGREDDSSQAHDRQVADAKVVIKTYFGVPDEVLEGPNAEGDDVMIRSLRYLHRELQRTKAELEEEKRYPKPPNVPINRGGAPRVEGVSQEEIDEKYKNLAREATTNAEYKAISKAWWHDTEPKRRGKTSRRSRI